MCDFKLKEGTKAINPASNPFGNTHGGLNLSTQQWGLTQHTYGSKSDNGIQQSTRRIRRIVMKGLLRTRRRTWGMYCFVTTSDASTLFCLSNRTPKEQEHHLPSLKYSLSKSIKKPTIIPCRPRPLSSIFLPGTSFIFPKARRIKEYRSIMWKLRNLKCWQLQPITTIFERIKFSFLP